MAQKHQSLFPQMSKKGPFTVQATGYEKVEGETIPRRHPAAKNGLINSPSEDVKTIFDIVKRSADKYGNAKALGSRKVVKVHHEKTMVKKVVEGQTQEVEKQWSYFELSGYSYISFVEYEKMVMELGSGLRKIGMEKGDRLHLFASTSPFWLAMSHAAASQSIPIATAYDTLGADGLQHSLKQTHAKAVYCDPQLMSTLGKTLSEATDVQFVIYNQEADVKQDMIDKLKSDFPRLTVMTVEELKKLGQQNPVDPVPPQPEDLCCIMYTSGSTGTPKGVPIKHQSVVSSIAGVTTIIGKYIGSGDGLLTYLPLAHILEYVFENACLYWGGTMGYGNPKTLSDTSVRNCKGDIREFKPSVLVGVPQVWESVRKGIVAKVEAGSPLVKNLFWSALTAKSFLMGSGIPGSGVLDAVVFKKIKDATGGRLKICMNGGGPISKDTQRFISMAIAPMVSGYGLTETTAMGGLMDPQHWTTDAIGDIPSSIEIKLVDFPDAGYFTSNTPPQGEIWIRGTSVLKEYYENEQETKESITEDGWFKTGDIGEWDKNGHLRIIDRKKNLVKTLNGEYIALEKFLPTSNRLHHSLSHFTIISFVHMAAASNSPTPTPFSPPNSNAPQLESIYRSAKVVANICVYASPEHTKPIAIIVPAEPALKKLAEQNRLAGEKSLEELVHEKKVQRAVLRELQAAGKQGGLVGIEIIEGVVLADEEWTAANGMVTAAQKIQRKAILNKYRKEVDEAYSGS